MRIVVCFIREEKSITLREAGQYHRAVAVGLNTADFQSTIGSVLNPTQ